jgi:hypothetical protein
MPSWHLEDHYGETDSPAARYQTAVDREFRTRLVEGWSAPDGWRRPTEPVCEKCSYVVVDGACVGCGPWAQPSLSERGQATRLLTAQEPLQQGLERDKGYPQPRSESDEQKDAA